MVVDGVTPFVVHNARWLSTFWLLGYTIGFFSAHPSTSSLVWVSAVASMAFLAGISTMWSP